MEINHPNSIALFSGGSSPLFMFNNVYISTRQHYTEYERALIRRWC